MPWPDYDELTVGVCEVSPDGYFLRANAYLCQLFGYREEDLIGQRVRDLTYPEDRAQTIAVVDRAQQNNQGQLQVFKRYIRSDGQIIDSLLTTVLKRDESGEPTHFFSYVEPVAERLKEPLPRALLERMQLLQEQERQALSRELHDELGQTLAALNMHLAWLQDKVSGTVASRVQHMILLAESLSASSTRLQSGLRPPILDDLGLVPAAASLLEETCGRANIAHQLRVPEESLKLDSEARLAVYRILQELLTNVIRHSKASQVEVDIFSSEGNVCVKVADNGVGMPPAPAGHPKGVGLTILRERVRMLYGTYQQSANHPHGLIVEVCLPMKRALDPERTVPPPWS